MSGLVTDGFGDFFWNYYSGRIWSAWNDIRD